MIEAAPARRGGEPAGLHRTRKLLTRWQPDDTYPAQVWLTNMHAPMPELIELSQAGVETARETTRLYDDVGLDHFEGRSFGGWHHHVTLTSLAHAYMVSLRRAELDCELRSCPHA